MGSTLGTDFVMPAPPLVSPPLSLLQLAITHLDTEDLVAQLDEAADKIASSQQALDDFDNGSMNIPGEDDSEGDAAKALAELQSQYVNAVKFESALRDRVADLSRWEQGFEYLPELGNGALSVFAPGSGTTKPAGNNQTPMAWYDPFVVIGHDDRSAFGWPNTDFLSREQRAQRALVGHEGWQAEYEFWTGTQQWTNYHLSASPNTPLVSADGERTIPAFPDPTPAPGTVLGTAVPLAGSLAALDQSIANADGGTGMIHATPYVVQEWMKLYPFIRDANGRVYTVNHNLLVPGYGYPGTGPDRANRTSSADGHTTNGSTTVTSASAAFTPFDIGRPISDGGTDIPAGAHIVSVTNATTVVISVAATGTETTAALTISGTGGDQTGSPQQWAYATEQVYACWGDIEFYPRVLRDTAPALTQNNDIPVRAERTRALITNRLLRAAVLVDTTNL